MENGSHQKYSEEDYLLESLDTNLFCLTCNNEKITDLPKYYESMKKAIGKKKAMNFLRVVYDAHNKNPLERKEFSSDDF